MGPDLTPVLLKPLLEMTCWWNRQEAIQKNPPEKPDKQPRKTANMEIIDVDSISSKDTPAKPENIEHLHPKKRGKRSSHPSEKKSAPDVSPPELQNAEKQLNKHGRDRQAGSRKTKAMQLATTSPRVSKRLTEIKDNNATDADAVQQPGASTTDACDQLQANAEKGSNSTTALLSSLYLESRASEFDLSRADYALLSLYGGSTLDPCIEFAVKILMAEMPLPKEAVVIEDCFRQQMSCKNTSKVKLAIYRDNSTPAS